MKTILTLLLGLFLCSQAEAQLAEPVQWSFQAEKLNSEIFKVTLSATIDEGWYVYSQDLAGKGPVPTRINFEPNQAFVLEGRIQETGDKKEEFDQNFNISVTKLKGKTTYIQYVKLSGNDVVSVKGKLMYMSCNGEMCLPPKKVDFNISLKP